MRRLPRWLLFTAFVLVLAVSALSSLAVVTVRESFPQTNGGVVVPALNARATVLRDAYGIPHIYADTPEDLFAAQGYVAAQDRFFEMDFRRHVTAGRLSELFGESQYETDVFIRTLGWRHTAEQEARQLSGSTRRYMEAYAAGVNAWLDTRAGGELSLEYVVLGLNGRRYQPDPWSVADSLAWFKAMSWDLSGNRLQETELATLATTVGRQRAAELYPAHDLAAFPPIVRRGAVVGDAFDPTAAARTTAPAPRAPGSAGIDDDELRRADGALTSVRRLNSSLHGLLGDLGAGGLGSNSWVISGERTTTGHPLLSNDPHLAASMPALFGQVGLHCTARDDSCPFDVTGFAFAGVPGVIIGHNTDIAWGLTNPYVDTQDLYVERLRGDQVQYGDDFEPIITRTEQIGVAGEPVPRQITVRSTRHGPLLSDVDATLTGATIDQESPDQTTVGVALRWTATDPGSPVEALFRLNAAANFDQFRAAARQWGSPSQNLTYADRFGTIGYQLPGDIPIRGRGDGIALNPGWDPAYEWTGMIPFDELPWEENPPSGYIVAANQPIIGEQYPYHLYSDASYGWRSARIEQLITSVDKVSPEDSQAWFADDIMPIAADLVPALLRVRVSDEWVAQGQGTLVGWDYRMQADSAAAAYFAVVYKQVLTRMFNDEMPPDLRPTGGERWFAVLADLLKDPDNRWWDDVTTPRQETRDDVLLAAMTQARKEITARLSRDPSGWRWGTLHTVELQHQSLGRSGIAPIEAIFNRGPRRMPGAGGAVNALGFDITRGDYTVTAGPTLRMLVDLGQLDRSRWINQSGVSGHVSHPHYDDQFPLWARNETIEMVSSQTRVRQNAVDELVLQPI